MAAPQESKLKFFYDNLLTGTGPDSSGTIKATSTESTGDFSVDYISNNLESNMWKASDTASPQNITFELSGPTAPKANYIIIYGHNFYSAGATVALQVDASTTFASTALVTIFSTVVADGIRSTDSVFFKNFNVVGDTSAPVQQSHWRINITHSSTYVPHITLAYVGLETELAFLQAPFDPYQQRVKANVNKSLGGFVTGVHTRYTERKLDIRLNNQSTSVYAKVKTWFEAHGVQNFFVGWNATGSTESTGDIWLVRPDLDFNNPINMDHFRDIKINLTGRKE